MLQSMKQAPDTRAEETVGRCDRPAWFTVERDCGQLEKQRESHYSLSVVTVTVMLERRNNNRHLASETVLLFC